MLLKAATRPEWTAAVLADLDAFLVDHAANERKASASALALVTHYPDRPELVARCIELAIEELEHFRDVHAHLARRGLTAAPDTRSEYWRRLSAHLRAPSDDYFLDRLVTGALVEARGCERFGLVAAALAAGELKDFYRELARSEVRHQGLFLELARTYFDEAAIATRVEALAEAEARVIAQLPIRPALY